MRKETKGTTNDRPIERLIILFPSFNQFGMYAEFSPLDTSEKKCSDLNAHFVKRDRRVETIERLTKYSNIA